MYRRPSKKQMLLQRIVMSVISVVAVLVIVTGTILFILGYRLDSEKGRLEQGALIQFDSIPGAADVSINGQYINARTLTKQSVIAGTHSFMMTKNGYKPWAKSLTVKAGTLTWLDYVRLVPEKLTTETMATFETIVGEKASPDLKKLLIQEKAELPAFQLVDISARAIKTTQLVLPETIYSEATTPELAHAFSLDHWDRGGRYMLLNHAFGDRNEWIVLDTQNVQASVNLTRLLSVNAIELEFAGTNGSVLYARLDDGTVRKIDLSSATISRALMTHVKHFDLFETNILSYVGELPGDASQQVAGVYRDGDESPHILRTTTAETPLSIDFARYYTENYVAIAEGVKVTILQGRYPASSNSGTSSLRPYDEFTVNAGVNLLSFSETDAYLVAQSGLTFVGYEVEHQRKTNATIVVTNDSTAIPVLRWLDPAYVWLDHGGKLTIREFDGTNMHDLGAVASGFDVTLSQNGRYIYSINKAGDSYQLQRVTMILE